MKKIAALILLVLPLYGNCAWVEIGSNQEFNITIYVDTEQTKSLNSHKSITSLYNYKLISAEFNKPHLSEVELNEFDCQKHLVRSPNITWYTGNMGKGSAAWKTQSMTWQPIPSGSAYEVIYKLVCSA